MYNLTNFSHIFLFNVLFLQKKMDYDRGYDIINVSYKQERNYQ